MPAVGGGQYLDHVHHGSRCTEGLQVMVDLDLAADVSERHQLAIAFQNRPGFPLTELIGNLRLIQVVRSSRAAAQVTVGQRHQLNSRDPPQQLSRWVGDSLGVRQVAGVVVSDANRPREADGPLPADFCKVGTDILRAFG